MIERHTKQTISLTLQYLVLVTTLLSFSLIVVGIILRVTESTTPCLDWPTCSGEWLVSPQSSTFLPYLHRLLTLLAGVGLVASFVFAWNRHRYTAWIVQPLGLATILMGIQVVVGRFVDSGGVIPVVSVIHFALALVILGLLVLPLVIRFSYSSSSSSSQSTSESKSTNFSFSSPFARISVVTLGAVLALFISGSLVTAAGAGSTCQSWPLCSELVFPTDYLGWINLAHRLMTLIVGILISLLVRQAWRKHQNQTAILVATTVVGVLFYSQALMGIVETTQGFPTYLVGLHVVTSVVFWAVMVTQFSLTGLMGSVKESGSEATMVLEKRKLQVLVKDYLVLTKPIVVALLLVTTFAGMVVGAKSLPPLDLTFWTLVGGFLAAGGSGAINQYIDRKDDTKMQRTAKRPIPSGRLTPGEGLAFGVAAALFSFYLMVAMVNFLAALLTLAGIIYYVVLYSILLKKTTVQNIVIGGGAGAIPPLVGWAAATGNLNIPSIFMFAVVFMWTPPHFWALALVRKRDYARAGVPMLPVVRGEKETRWLIFLYTLELVVLTLVLPIFGLGGGLYFIAAVLLGGLLLYSAWKVWRGEGNKVAWKMYRHSSMYLAFLFLALMVDALW